MLNRPDLERMLCEDAEQRLRLRRTAIDLINEELQFQELLGAAGVSSMPYRKAAILHDQILQPLESGDYERADQELNAFLSEWPMELLMRRLVNDVKPDLQLILRGLILSDMLRRQSFRGLSNSPSFRPPTVIPAQAGIQRRSRLLR